MNNNSLHDLFETFIKEHPIAKENKDNNFIKSSKNMIESIFKSYITNQQNNEKYKYKVGLRIEQFQNWSGVPWLGIHNVQLSPSGKQGIYIAYLFPSDLKTKNFYLTLIQACETASFKEMEKLKNCAIKIIQSVAARGFRDDGKLYLGDYGASANLRPRNYEKGTIFYKEYKKDNVPDDKTLLDDFDKMMEIYKEVADNPNLWATDFDMAGETKNVKTEEEPKMSEFNLNNEIYYGVPGTGKTFAMQRDYINNSDKKENTFSTTFHQSFSYEEFVEGLKAELTENKTQVAYNVKPGIFFEACEKAAKLAGYENLKQLTMAPETERKEKIQAAISANKIVYFCIDEINRGNIASIFGDLISLIETSKRLGAEKEMIVTLPYSKNKFGVPANLKIIGTMNTVDRSIQLLDSALRRRFTFIECAPKYDSDENVKYKNKKASEVLKVINNRIRAYLGKDYQIGHTYLMNCENDLEIFKALRDKIIPLLEEYFYGETDKIRNILNERDEYTNGFYIKDEAAEKAYKDMTGADDYEEKKFYILSNKLLSVSKEDASNFIEHIIK